MTKDILIDLENIQLEDMVLDLDLGFDIDIDLDLFNIDNIDLNL